MCRRQKVEKREVEEGGGSCIRSRRGDVEKTGGGRREGKGEDKNKNEDVRATNWEGGRRKHIKGDNRAGEIQWRPLQRNTVFDTGLKLYTF